MEKVAPVTVEPTTITDSASFIADKTYTYSKNIVVGEKLAAAAGNLTPKMLYLDKYGYVISVADPFVPANYGVILAVQSVTFPTASTNVYLLKSDGKAAVVNGAIITGGTGAVGDIVAIDESTPGLTILDVKASAAAPAAAVTSIKPGVVVSTTKAGTFKANDKTLFLLSYKTTTGSTKYASYVGVANVPEMNGSANYTVFNVGGYAAAVYVDTATFPAAAATTQTMVYADFSSATLVQDATKGNYWTMNAVVDGVAAKIEVSNDVKKGMSGDEIWGAVTKDANGIITAKSTYAGTGIAIVTGKTGTTAAADGIVKFGTGSAAVELTYTDNTQVFKLTFGGATKTTVDGITDDANDTVIYVTKNGVLTAAFITVV